MKNKFYNFFSMTYFFGIESHLIWQIRRRFYNVNKVSRRNISMEEMPQKFPIHISVPSLLKNGSKFVRLKPTTFFMIFIKKKVSMLTSTKVSKWEKPGPGEKSVKHWKMTLNNKIALTLNYLWIYLLYKWGKTLIFVGSWTNF